MAGTHTSALLLPSVIRGAGLDAPATTPRIAMARVRSLGHRYYGGAGVLTGTVKVKGSPNYPVARPVRLFRDRDAVCVGEVWSDPTTGAYQFVDLDPSERYTAMALDYVHTFRAAVGDNLPVD